MESIFPHKSVSWPDGSDSAISYSFHCNKPCSPWAFFEKKKTSRVCYECLCLEERQNNNNKDSNNSTRLSNSSTHVPRTQRTTKVPQECRKAYGLGNRRLLLSPRTCLRLGQTLGVCPVRSVLHICHLRGSLASSRDKALCYQMAEAGPPLWAPDMGVERQSPRIGEGWEGKVCLHVSFP